jgi:hypothetical protein
LRDHLPGVNGVVDLDFVAVDARADAPASAILLAGDRRVPPARRLRNIAARAYLWQMSDMFTRVGDSYTGEFIHFRYPQN